jgi:hypothetical protein
VCDQLVSLEADRIPRQAECTAGFELSSPDGEGLADQAAAERSRLPLAPRTSV